MNSKQRIKSYFNLFTIVFMLICAQRVNAQSDNQTMSDIQKKDVRLKNNLDPSTPLIMRVTDAPESVLKSFLEAGMSPRKHILTVAERSIVIKALDELTPLHKRVLLAHLQSISFLDDMPNTALTSLINPGDPYPVFNITFRAAILKQNLSQWITEKERTCFNTDGSSLSVSIKAGTLDAMDYVLMHESTHVVDGSLTIAPGKNAVKVPENSFVTGVWLNRTTIAPFYYNSWLDSTRFRHGRVLPISLADSVYTALEHTPFVTLYSTSSWHEDLAEFISVYNFTQLKKQPFRIVLSDGNKEILSYEPMKSKLVRERIKYIKLFYANS